MSYNNGNNIITPSHRSSLSSRASKIPQRLAQSSFFSLRPSASTMVSNNGEHSERLATRIGQIFFRQRTNSETTIMKDSRLESTITLDTDIHQIKTKKDTNNETNHPPYSIPPETTNIYPYYASKEDNATNLFTPHSYTNSSVSSLADSVNTNNTPSAPSSPNLPPNTHLPISQMIHPTQLPQHPLRLNQDTLLTFDQFHETITERCTYLINMTDITCVHLKEIDSILNDTLVFIRACETTDDFKLKLTDDLNELRPILNAMDPIDKEKVNELLQDTKNICQTCVSFCSDRPSLSTLSDGFKKESPRIFKTPYTSDDYRKMVPDQIDPHAVWFRRYFVGKPYTTFIGSLEPIGSTSNNLIGKKRNNSSQPSQQQLPKLATRRNSKSLLNTFRSSTEVDTPPDPHLGIISVIQERITEANNKLGHQYRIIIRSREPHHSRYVIHEYSVKDTQTQLDSRGEGHRLDKVAPIDHHRRLRPFSRNHHPANTENNANSRIMRAAILSACPDLDLSSFKELSAESTIISGLEKDLLKYDEIHIPKHYKFGLLTIQNDQTTEESWFSNTGLSKDLQDFVDIMGTKVGLKGFNGYAAGLDTRTGESGEYAYMTKWKDSEVMFHIASIMPSHAHDKQQISRKKHIGNDIVCIIFIDGDQTFDPKAIRSQFLHVYIIVKAELVNNQRVWRVEVVRNKNVRSFGPALPCPPLFHTDADLKEYLILKLINAENAALKSDKFFIPNNKARLSLLSNHIQTGSTFELPEIMRTASTNRLSSDQDRTNKMNKQDIKSKRPKSVTNKPISGSRLLREAMLDEARNGQRRVDVTMGSADIPPMPSLSKSTLLQDFKKNLARRKINKTVDQSNDAQVLRKSSQLKISSVIEVPPKDIKSNYKLPIKSKDLFIGEDINISSESFISECQLFSSSTTTNNSKCSYVDNSSTITDPTESVSNTDTPILLTNDSTIHTPPFLISTSTTTAIHY